ncbi:hypothetical protein CPC08DRAFT_180189 [Agrocybe pediades]|nr:hypothetical protein CPC08DRAFT_180189 [Agrocybe pediades]
MLDSASVISPCYLSMTVYLHAQCSAWTSWTVWPLYTTELASNPSGMGDSDFYTICRHLCPAWSCRDWDLGSGFDMGSCRDIHRPFTGSCVGFVHIFDNMEIPTTHRQHVVSIYLILDVEHEKEANSRKRQSLIMYPRIYPVQYFRRKEYGNFVDTNFMCIIFVLSLCTPQCYFLFIQILLEFTRFCYKPSQNVKTIYFRG